MWGGALGTGWGRVTVALCVWWGGSKRGQYCCWLTSGGLPCSRPISSHFIHFSSLHPPVCGWCLPAAALVVVHRAGRFVYILGSPERSAVYSATPKPTGFRTSYEIFFFSWHWSPGLCGLAWGWAHSLTRCLPDFYPPHVNVQLLA